MNILGGLHFIVKYFQETLFLDQRNRPKTPLWSLQQKTQSERREGPARVLNGQFSNRISRPSMNRRPSGVDHYPQRPRVDQQAQRQQIASFVFSQNKAQRSNSFFVLSNNQIDYCGLGRVNDSKSKIMEGAMTKVMRERVSSMAIQYSNNFIRLLKPQLTLFIKRIRQDRSQKQRVLKQQQEKARGLSEQKKRKQLLQSQKRRQQQLRKQAESKQIQLKRLALQQQKIKLAKQNQQRQAVILLANRKSTPPEKQLVNIANYQNYSRQLKPFYVMLNYSVYIDGLKAEPFEISELKFLQNHKKALVSMCSSAKKLQFLVLKGKSPLSNLKILYDVIRQWILKSQKQRLQQLPPYNKDDQINKNTILCYAIIINLALYKHKQLRLAFLSLMLKAVFFIFKREPATKFSQIDLFKKGNWLDFQNCDKMSHQNFGARVDQILFYFFSVLNMDPGIISAHIKNFDRTITSEEVRNIEIGVSSHNDELQRSIGYRILSMQSNLYKPLALYNYLLTIVPKLVYQYKKTRSQVGPHWELFRKIKDVSKSIGKELQDNREIKTLCQQVDEEILQQMVVKNGIKYLKQAVEVLQQAKVDEDFEKVNSLYYFKIQFT